MESRGHHSALRAVLSIPLMAASLGIVGFASGWLGQWTGVAVAGWLLVAAALPTRPAARLATRMLGFRRISTPVMRLDRLLSDVFRINRLRHDAIDWYIASRASEVNAFCLADRNVVLTAGFVRAYTEGRLAHRHALAILNHEAGHHHHRATRYNYTLAWLTLPCRIWTAMARGLVRRLSRSIPAARLGLILVPVIATVAVVQMVQAGQWGGLAALVLLGFVAWVQPVVNAAVCRNSEFAADRYVASLGCAGDLAEALALYAGRGECRGWQQTHPPTAARIARLRSMGLPARLCPRTGSSRTLLSYGSHRGCCCLPERRWP